MNLLIQGLFCLVRVVVQNLFKVILVPGAVVQLLKMVHLLSKVTRYAERINRMKEWSVDRKKAQHYRTVTDLQETSCVCPCGWCNLQRVFFKNVLVPIVSWSQTSHPRQNNNPLRGIEEDKLQRDDIKPGSFNRAYTIYQFKKYADWYLDY